jgi:hypothetical protein
LSLATPDSAARDAIKEDTGIDAAVLGPLYGGSLNVNGFTMPLPGSKWVKVAAAKVKGKTFTGVAYFLVNVSRKRLTRAIIVQAVRTIPGVTNDVELFHVENQPAVFRSDGCDEKDTGARQSCWMIFNYYASNWQRWGDRTAKVDNLARAAAGDMAAKGISYPQDLIDVQFVQSDTWGALSISYLFNPEMQSIQSHPALSFVDSDWASANITRYPEKLAYVDTLKQWGSSMWPHLQSAFAAGK